MAVNMECSECGNIQSVGIVANGVLGRIDPETKCEKCGKKSSGFFAPGTKSEMEQRIQEAREGVFAKLDEVFPPQATA